jgi:hypothetical protein
MSSHSSISSPLGAATNNSMSAAANNMRVAINLNEKDIIKLIIEFLANRDLNISMLDLERETGVINGAYSDDMLFLRQLILDGQWDDAIEFIQPLKQIDLFNSKQFYYIVMKYQYLELLCLKTEANTIDNQLSVDQLVTYLNDLRPYCPTEDDYKKLCLLLTSSRLQDHSEYKSWNPSSGRLQCFKEIFPLVSKFLANDSLSNSSQSIRTSQNERLTQLIVKGLLYESCVEYCQARATSSIESYNLSDPNILLMQMHLSETDASLLSWLHALPFDTFSCPFEEKPLKLSMDRFVKPNLEATWADAILATPIKPQQLFPYNAVPSGRSRNTELMSRSLAPQYEGLSFGLSKSQIFTSGIEMKLNQSNNNHNNNSNSTNNSNNNVTNNRKNNVNDITRSIALFNIDTTSSSIKQPTMSTTSPTPSTTNITNNTGNLLTSSFINNRHHHPIVLNGIKEEDVPVVTSPVSSSSSMSSNSSSNKLNKSTSSAAGKKKKQTDEDNNINNKTENNTNNLMSSPSKQSNPMVDSTLFREYQKNKAQIIQQLEEQEKKREEFVKQLKCKSCYYLILSFIQIFIYFFE